MDKEPFPTSPLVTQEEKEVEAYLRPKYLSEFIGQEAVKLELKVAIEAVKQRKGDVLEHILFFGPPGLGKTTLGHIIASELNAPIKAIQAPTLQIAADLAALLSSLEDNSVLFLDEIHRLHPAVEELLYQGMENFSLDIVVGRGVGARSVHVSLPRFTLIGATTRASRLTPPLRDRFGIISRLDYYSSEELSRIIEINANKLQLKIKEEVAYKIGCRSRGTPRVANRLLRRIRDFAQLIQGLDKEIGPELVEEVFSKLGVGEDGLDRTDIFILQTIRDKFRGGPVGLKTLAATLQEDEHTIEDVYEPYLLRLGYIIRTSKGRCLTPHAYKKLFISSFA